MRNDNTSELALHRRLQQAGHWEADLVRGHGGNDLDELGEVGLDQGAALGRHHPFCTNSLHSTKPSGSDMRNQNHESSTNEVVVYRQLERCSRLQHTQYVDYLRAQEPKA